MMVTDDELVALAESGKSQRAIAEQLGLNRRTVERRFHNLARKGYSPRHNMTHIVPDGFAVKGVSTLYKPDGTVAAQWVKSRAEYEREVDAINAVADDLARSVKGSARHVARASKVTSAAMASAYVLGDPHIGMYSWAAESGEDFDTTIAARDLCAASDLLADTAPQSSTAYLVSVGDTLHADNRSNATPEHKNLLDVDTRYQRVIRIAVQTLRYSVDRLLRKHDTVKVFMVPGNHDPDSAGWLSLVLASFYSSEPRVIVEQSPNKYLYQRFGATLIGMTHGDKTKMADLPGIMAVDRAKDWGEAKYRYWWTGHIHHQRVQEFRGCVVESFNTLAAPDAWNHASGFRSYRQAQRIDIDAEDGIFRREIASIDRVRRML